MGFVMNLSLADYSKREVNEFDGCIFIDDDEEDEELNI